MIKSHQKIFYFLALSLPALATKEELRWDWRNINLDNIAFNRNFMFGTAVAEHQVSGTHNCPHSQWALWDYAKDKHGNPRIHEGQKSGVACDFWNRYRNDIELLKQMGVKAFRFSLDWSAIEPEPGVINKEAVAHYHDLCTALHQAGIIPCVTLHHFTHPQWFEKIGGFEYEENIQYFVNFSTFAAQEFGAQVPMWSTFNEPGVYVFQSYIRGVWPPGKIGMNRASQVLKHMLQAHIGAYKAMKKMNARIQIGLVHSVTQFDPYNPDNIVERNVCHYLNHTFHDAITEFFATGNYHFYVPVLADLRYKNKAATKSLDFFGINYYSHVLLRVPLNLKNAGQAYRDNEIRTDMPYCIYPEGMYRAIVDISNRIARPQNIPIYITENGIADAKDDRRGLFIKQYLYAVHKAIQDGYDVRGYFYWSLLDNFEWTEGYTMKFGLYDVNWQTQERKLRDGARPYLEIIKRTYN